MPPHQPMSVLPAGPYGNIPSKEAVQLRSEMETLETPMKVIKLLTRVVHDILNDKSGELVVCGSFAQGTAIAGSDLDLALVFKDDDVSRDDQVSKLESINNGVKKVGKLGLIVEEAVLAPTAVVPILKLLYRNDGEPDMPIDLSIGNKTSGRRDAIVKEILDANTAAKFPLSFVKMWAKKRRVIRAYEGFANSVSWSLLFITHCQVIGILPSYDNINTWKPSTAQLTELQILTSFFGFVFQFGSDGTFAEYKCSVLDGRLARRSEIEQLQASPLSVEDPIDTSHNVARSCQQTQWQSTVSHAQHALITLSSAMSLDDVTDKLLCEEDTDSSIPPPPPPPMYFPVPFMPPMLPVGLAQIHPITIGTPASLPPVNDIGSPIHKSSDSTTSSLGESSGKKSRKNETKPVKVKKDDVTPVEARPIEGRAGAWSGEFARAKLVPGRKAVSNNLVSNNAIVNNIIPSVVKKEIKDIELPVPPQLSVPQSSNCSEELAAAPMAVSSSDTSSNSPSHSSLTNGGLSSRALLPGMGVEVFGLRNQKEINGSKGVIVSVEKDNLRVELGEKHGGCTVPSKNLRVVHHADVFPINSRVRVTRLKNQKELNGTNGEIRGYESGNMIRVKFDLHSQGRSVPAANLIPSVNDVADTESTATPASTTSSVGPVSPHQRRSSISSLSTITSEEPTLEWSVITVSPTAVIYHHISGCEYSTPPQQFFHWLGCELLNRISAFPLDAHKITGMLLESASRHPSMVWSLLGKPADLLTQCQVAAAYLRHHFESVCCYIF